MLAQSVTCSILAGGEKVESGGQKRVVDRAVISSEPDKPSQPSPEAVLC